MKKKVEILAPAKMKNVISLSEWKFTKNISEDKRILEVSIHLIYPDTKSLLKYAPIERKKRVQLERKNYFNQLISSNLFENYTILGSTSKPSGIKTSIPYSLLPKISKFRFVKTIFIIKMSHAKRIVHQPSTTQFYCVRMTVAIEIEGKKKGLQSIEDRFVLIKAKDYEDAYRKIEKQKKQYAEPYLNSNGELVRWRIESLDDCYSVDIQSLDDFNDSEGVEVFSAMKSRKLTESRIWDGKTND